MKQLKITRKVMKNILTKILRKLSDEETTFILDQGTAYGNLVQEFIKSAFLDFESYRRTKRSSEKLLYLFSIIKFLNYHQEFMKS